MHAYIIQERDYSDAWTRTVLLHQSKLDLDVLIGDWYKMQVLNHLPKLEVNNRKEYFELKHKRELLICEYMDVRNIHDAAVKAMREEFGFIEVEYDEYSLNLPEHVSEPGYAMPPQCNCDKIASENPGKNMHWRCPMHGGMFTHRLTGGSK